MSALGRRILWTSMTSLTLAFFSATSNAQDPPSGDATPSTIATGALQKFSKLVTAENYLSLGFLSREDAKKLTVGQPVASYSVRLDELRQYTPNASPEGLIKHPPHYIFPVLVGGQLRSSIEVAQVGSSWKAVRFGAPQRIQSIDKLRSDKARELGLVASAFIVIRVPALNLVLLGHRLGTSLLLTPTSDRPSFELRAGATLPAEILFLRLVPAAQKLDTEAPS